MKNARLLPQILSSILTIPIVSVCAHAGQPDTVPAIRDWQERNGSLTLASGFQIVAVSDSENSVNELSELAEMFAHDVRYITGMTATTKDADESSGGAVYLDLREVAKILSDESYVLDIQDDVNIRASTLKGLFYGTQTVLQLLQRTDEGWALPNGYAVDWNLWRRPEQV